jgi:hypothetical protein
VVTGRSEIKQPNRSWVRVIPRGAASKETAQRLAYLRYD